MKTSFRSNKLAAKESENRDTTTERCHRRVRERDGREEKGPVGKRNSTESGDRGRRKGLWEM